MRLDSRRCQSSFSTRMAYDRSSEKRLSRPSSPTKTTRLWETALQSTRLTIDARRKAIRQPNVPLWAIKTHEASTFVQRCIELIICEKGRWVGLANRSFRALVCDELPLFSYFNGSQRFLESRISTRLQEKRTTEIVLWGQRRE